MKVEKTRLDLLLVSRGLFPSREAARRAIMAGKVTRNGEVLDKPGTTVKTTDAIEVAEAESRYVSRGGLKLEKALDVFHYDLTGRIVVDVGASTGGFTDCALRHGASRVYSVDVGYGQLAWSLRIDPRVVVMERTNFRYVDASAFDPVPQVAVMDVSFISIRLLLPKLRELLAPPGDILTLIKPQFEAGRAFVGKGGIVRDPAVHQTVLTGILNVAHSMQMTCHGLDFSPISGGDGNIEYLAWFQPGGGPVDDAMQRIPQVVTAAWRTLKHQEISLKPSDLRET
ncbi:MAG: TlyA family RNA methyltransferase [Alicyclobacillus sp.]|nr:TlyA family RNA methyltransferase [Alicyclobacillus sp.]